MRESLPPFTDPELSIIAKIERGLISFDVVTDALVVKSSLPVTLPSIAFVPFALAVEVIAPEVLSFAVNV